MERLFTNKSIWRKIVIVFLIIIVFQYVCSISLPIVYADDDDGTKMDGDNVVEKGILMKPIMSLVTSLGDGIMYVIHYSIMGPQPSLIHISLTDDNVFISAIRFMGRVYMMTHVGGLAYLVVTELMDGPSIVEEQQNDLKVVTDAVLGSDTPNDLYLPLYTFTPEEIFKGNIMLFNIDFFKESSQIIEDTNQNGDKIYYIINSEGEKVPTSQTDSAELLRKTVSKWYNIIRNICIVGMLSVLLYIGIRMLLSTIASDRAKYLEMLKDWLVGLCLLFVMHYIMAFSVTLVQKITDIVSSTVDKNFYAVTLYCERKR